MGIFKNVKKRYIVLVSVCIVIIVSCGIYIAITLWPKEEKAPELPKTNTPSQQQQEEGGQSSSDGPLYTIISCEDLKNIYGITSENCPDDTETPNYQTYTPSYTAPESTPAQTPTQYNVPSVEPTPTYTPDCAALHTKYYATYQQKVSQARQSYNTGVSNASMQCAGNGGSYSGCTSLAERKLKAQLNSNIQTYQSEYKQNMTSDGCNPNQYVDF